MNEEDYPNFGNAFPASTTSTSATDGQASWNPALRPDTDASSLATKLPPEVDADDDFFDRYPGATPEKHRRFRSIPTDRSSPEHGTPNGPSKDERENKIMQDERNEEQDVAMEGPAAHYEHQSEVTALDEALDESVEAPLIKDEQPEPTVALITEAPTATARQDAPIMPGRSFTTNFTELPEVTPSVQPAVPQSDEWPAVGDDKTFAELLDNPQQPANDPVTDTNPDKLREASDQDLTAAWAAALDDDEILDEQDETDPTAFFGEDDDGFLLEDEDLHVAQVANDPPEAKRTVSSYTPSAISNSTFQPFSSSADQNHGRTAGTPDTGLYGLHTFNQPDSQTTTRPALTTTQSFVDKPRSDYQSPYDLPIDVVKPRRRPQASVQSSQNMMSVPPPRSSSFGAANAPTIPNQPFGAASVASLTPPSSSHGQGLSTESAFGAAKASGTANGFFADLPATAKARPRPNTAYTSQPHALPNGQQRQLQQTPMQNTGLPAAPPQLRPSQSYAGPSHVSQQSSLAAGFRQPERAPLFPDQPSDHTMTNGFKASPPGSSSSTTSAQARYSPVLPPTTQTSSSASRYSPAPADPTGRKANGIYSSSPSSAPQFPPSRQAQPFLPRTSSPLATHGRPVARQMSVDDGDRRTDSLVVGSPGKQTSGTMSPERRDLSQYRHASSEQRKPPIDIPAAQYGSPPAAHSTRPTQSYNPAFAGELAGSSHILRAAQVHSESRTSAQGHLQTRLPHRRQFSKDLQYSAPPDERAQDPLQRWKGHAIFHWSSGGLVASSLPRQTPYYGTGSQGPIIKCTPGDVKIVEAKQVFALDEVDAKFPGPLSGRSKSKKKELLTWLTDKIAIMQRTAESLKSTLELPEADRVAYEEKLVLWKVMQVYLENDGVLEGSPKLEEQVRQILMPDLAQKAQVVELQSPTSGRGLLAGDVLDTAVISQIRQALFEGRREYAVQLAEEKHLWGHAMLIASTMDADNFRQIISSFVRSQVKSQGGSEFKSLASLYQVFAGSPDDCVDELVPPSARAGFQMISTTDGRGTGEALGGLDKWRETVSLVHSNPTPHNAASIVAIGRLLKSYDRIDAAHICFLLARATAKHGGADDQEADWVLFGTDATKGNIDLDAMMLTEIFEFASSLSGQSNQAQYIPHLQAYKFLHGQNLAAYGLKHQAQQYCDHIDAAIKSTTRPSGYYHQAFAQELIKFNEYLSQSPHVGGGAGGKFFSRPAIGKVSSGVGSWFTKFVSGDEGDTDSNASGQAAAEGEVFGPFGGVNANSMPISRTTSTTDLHNPVMASNAYSPQLSMPSSLPKRYTPQSHGSSSKYAPLTSAASRTSLESDRSFSYQAPSAMPSAEPIRAASTRYAPTTSAGNSPALLAVQGAPISRRASNQSLLSNGSYEPRPMLAEHDGFGYSQGSEGTPEVAADPFLHSNDETPQYGETETDNSYGGPSHSTQPDQGYVPPTLTYEPPTADAPYADEEDFGSSTATIKKKSIMDDDDDDFVARAAALKLSQPQTSRDPDPAVLAAAQAEAARDSQGQDRRASGWFGWFGKKDASAAPGPIKAKLGEENSFYFDKDLNKWVNKKGGSDGASSAAPTPPPPRAASGAPSGPPSRAPSSSLPPMNGPPSRLGTPSDAPPATQPRPTSSSSGVPDSVPGNMGPPPRPSSSMSTASSLDDLLGGPGAGRRAGSAKPKKKAGRYVDVMANAK